MPEPRHSDISLNGLQPLHRARARGVLLACLVLSVTLHAALIALLPAFVLDTGAPPVRVLDVVLVQPRVLPPAPAELPAPPAPAAGQPAAKPPVTRRAPATAPGKTMQETAQEPELRQPALSGQRAQAPFAPVPAEDAAPAAQAAPPAPQAQASARPEAVPLTPPVFNASYLRNPPPRYPLIARRNGEQGTVTLRVKVTQQGMPASVGIETSSGSSHLDDAAREAVRGWRFVPARKGSEPVEAWVLVPVVFRLEG